MAKNLVFISRRYMRQLACRFCGASEFIHVVDPLLDLRYRFDSEATLANMLEARGQVVDVARICRNYMRWWKAYEIFCSTIVDGKPDVGHKKLLLSEADGLLEVLRLPNNIADLSAPSSSAHASTKEPKHMAFLSKSGMLKRRGYPPSLDMVGLPTTVTFSLQQKLINLLSEVAIFISPPHMVRGAIVEGVNLPLENFLAFTDGSVVGFPVYLTGHSLPSLISLFVKKLIPFRSTTWPLRVFSSGTAYQNFLLNPRREEGCAFKLNLGNVAQRTKVAMLSFCRSRVEELAEFSLLKTLILELCNKSLSYEFSFVELHPNALHSYESAAVVLLYGTDVIARIGCSGEYISQRLNIACGEDRVSSKFAWLIYTEIDVTSAIGMIVEEHVMGESPIPEDIRELI